MAASPAGSSRSSPTTTSPTPRKRLVQVQKAIDSGIRFITQGNGSAFAAAISDFVTKYNDRNPGKEVLYFNYAAVDPVSDQRQMQLTGISAGTPTPTSRWRP